MCVCARVCVLYRVHIILSWHTWWEWERNTAITIAFNVVWCVNRLNEREKKGVNKMWCARAARVTYQRQCRKWFCCAHIAQHSEFKRLAMCEPGESSHSVRYKVIVCMCHYCGHFQSNISFYNAIAMRLWWTTFVYTVRSLARSRSALPLFCPVSVLLYFTQFSNVSRCNKYFDKSFGVRVLAGRLGVCVCAALKIYAYFMHT